MTATPCDCRGAPHKVWCAVRRQARADRLAGAARGAPRKSAAAMREQRRAEHAAGWRRILADNAHHGRRGAGRCGA